MLSRRTTVGAGGSPHGGSNRTQIPQRPCRGRQPAAGRVGPPLV